MRSDPPAAVLANYVNGARFEQLPAGVAEWATALVQDNLGCMLGALALPESRCTLAMAEDSGPGIALAIGSRSTSVGAAVFCNSQLANLLDFDDTHDSRAPFHPGCIIIPTALAVAQSTRASGREFLTAVTVAYEVGLRIGSSLGNTLWNVGTPWTAVGELAAAIAAAKLYPLDASQLRALFSIVSLDEAGIAQQPRRRIKGDVPSTRTFGTLKAHFGALAQAGVCAARKACAGLTAVPGLLEQADWYRAGLPDSAFERLTASLGQEYLSLTVSLKPTPSCRWTHAPITAARAALGNKTLRASHVQRIRILGVPRLERRQWSSVYEAQYSIPCAVALAVSGIEPGPMWYVDGAFKSPPILELAAKVVQELDPAAEEAEMRSGRIACRIEIDLSDGSRLTGNCQAAKGSVHNPLSPDERRAKFAANTAHLSDQGEGVAAAISELANAETLEELVASLKGLTADRRGGQRSGPNCDGSTA